MIREGEQTDTGTESNAGRPSDGNGRRIASAIAEGSHIGDYIVGRSARPDRLFLKYFGTHAAQQTPVFLKVFRPGITVERGAFDTLIHKLRALNHPSILPILDGGHHDSLHFIVEPVIDGFSLFEGLRADHFLDEDKPKVIQEMSEGLSALHDEGVIHGDLSTDTVFVSSDDIALVAGYGFSRLFAGQGPQRLDTSLRRFCAPEVLGGQMPDIRSDVYSFAAVCACFLLGKEHWEHSDAQLSGVVMKPAVKACLQRGMAKKPEDRPQAVSGFAGELLGALAGRGLSLDADSGDGAEAGGGGRSGKSGKKTFVVLGVAGGVVAAAAFGAAFLKLWARGSNDTAAEDRAAAAARGSADVPTGDGTDPQAVEAMPTPVPPTPTPAGPGATNAWLQRVPDWPEHFRVAVLVPGMVPWKHPAVVVFDDGAAETKQALESIYAGVEKDGLMDGVVRILERPTDTVSLAPRFGVTTRPQVLFVDVGGNVQSRFNVPPDPAEFVSKLKEFAPKAAN